MGGIRRRDLSRELDGAVARFREWRRGRQPGTRIPDGLWALAVRLADSQGLNRTAKSLGLDYNALKKRVGRQNGGVRANAGRAATSTFVEVTPVVSVSRECVIERECRDGARMRIQLQGYDAADVVELGCRLWNGE